jgi:uncharacterized membrane protein YeaQ/YmgE (transglycosylase-associated protein family)
MQPILIDLQSLSVLAIVGIAAGYLVSAFVRNYGLGLVGNMMVGVVGAFLAAWFLPRLIDDFELINPLVTSIAYATTGAVIFLVFVGLIAGTD